MGLKDSGNEFAGHETARTMSHYNRLVIVNWQGTEWSLHWWIIFMRH